MIEVRKEAEERGTSMNLFDILGPVMVGPSSSHTAGAVRIGLAALCSGTTSPSQWIRRGPRSRNAPEHRSRVRARSPRKGSASSPA